MPSLLAASHQASANPRCKQTLSRTECDQQCALTSDLRSTRRTATAPGAPAAMLGSLSASTRGLSRCLRRSQPGVAGLLRQGRAPGGARASSGSGCGAPRPVVVSAAAAQVGPSPAVPRIGCRPQQGCFRGQQQRQPGDRRAAPAPCACMASRLVCALRRRSRSRVLDSMQRCITLAPPNTKHAHRSRQRRAQSSRRLRAARAGRSAWRLLLTAVQRA